MATIRYKEGFPTLVDTPRLDRMLRELGKPVEIKRFGQNIVIEWAPIYPEVPIPQYILREPFRDSKGRIPIEGVTLDSAEPEVIS